MVDDLAVRRALVSIILFFINVALTGVLQVFALDEANIQEEENCEKHVSHPGVVHGIPNIIVA